MFLLAVIAVDYLDPSEPDTAKIPRFQDIQDVCPEDLKSSVLFPEFSFRPLQNNRKKKKKTRT